MLAFCSSPRYVEHVTGPHHPERPERICAIHRAVRQAGLIASPDPFPQFDLDLRLRPAGIAAMLEVTPELADEKWLLTVHSPAHIQRVRHVCLAGGGVLDQGDTPVIPISNEIALLSLGGALRCCDAVAGGEARRAFAAVRPPGHHAEADRAMGFCIYSNLAIAARYLQRQHGVEKIAIVDFDVHHGNGTQAAFQADPSVLFISLHQDPRTCYPGSGYEWEIGIGRGRGFTLNVPLPPGTEDEEYLAALGEKALPAIDKFHPEILLISAGFDGHRDDPLADLRLSDEGYERITRLLVQAANTHCGGRIVSVLEGGYNLAALGRSVVRHLIALSD